MTTLAAGSNATIVLRDTGQCTVTTSGGFADVAETVGSTTTNHAFGPRPKRMVFGPYSEGATIVITNASAVLDYDSPYGNLVTFDEATQSLVSGDGTPFPGTGTTVTATGALPATALGRVTPYNSGSAGVLSLPDAATAWAANPYAIVVVSQKGAGAASFAASGSDTLRATSGISTSSVQYGMIAAQIISATEWALA